MNIVTLKYVCSSLFTLILISANVHSINDANFVERKSQANHLDIIQLSQKNDNSLIKSLPNSNINDDYSTGRNSNNLTDKVATALNVIKQYMKGGNPFYSIPNLDPYSFNTTSSLYQEDGAHVTADITADLLNLSQFNWDKLYTCLFSKSFQITMILKDLIFNGTYTIDGSLYDIIPLYGHGDFLFKIGNLNATITAQFTDAPYSKHILKVESSLINLNEIDGVKFDFGEIFENDTLAKIINNFTTDISAVILNRFVGLFELNLAEILRGYLDAVFGNNDITVTDVLDYIDKLQK